MLPPTMRLPSHLVRLTLAHGKRVRFPYGVCVYRISDEDHTRCAIILGKKTAKQAVVRNSIKRRLRAAIQHTLTQDNAPGRDMVFVLHTNIRDVPYKDIERAICECAKKCKRDERI